MLCMFDFDFDLSLGLHVTGIFMVFLIFVRQKKKKKFDGKCQQKSLELSDKRDLSQGPLWKI